MIDWSKQTIAGNLPSKIIRPKGQGSITIHNTTTYYVNVGLCAPALSHFVNRLAPGEHVTITCGAVWFNVIAVPAYNNGCSDFKVWKAVAKNALFAFSLASMVGGFGLMGADAGGAFDVGSVGSLPDSGCGGEQPLQAPVADNANVGAFNPEQLAGMVMSKIGVAGMGLALSAPAVQKRVYGPTDHRLDVIIEDGKLSFEGCNH